MTSMDMPEWVRHAIFYQIFPERFARSERVDKPSNLEPWDSAPTVHGFKGGDLLGVVEHLQAEIVDTGGRYILKPNPLPFADVPANESLTMTMAAAAGIEVPPHGLLPTVDGGWIYVVRRFDREGRNKRISVEDFAQLAGATRETKYDSSLERVAKVVEEFCTFPALEKPKLARRLLFCFLTGNEDMHLKNFSVIVRDKVVSLSPAYDLLNSTLVLEKAVEESALTLNGKKRKLTRQLWLDYFCTERLGLPARQLDNILADLRKAHPAWHELIDRSYLPEEKKGAYHELLEERFGRLSIGPQNS